MARPGRNEACPCGSKLKYKRCCLPKDEAARREAVPAAPPRRIITHQGRPLLVSGGGRDLPHALLDHAVEFFEAKDSGEGPAAQMMCFAEPLLDAAGDDEVGRQRALSLGVAFWNMAVCDEAEREEMLADLTGRIDEFGHDETELRALAATMVARHRMMFPVLHGS